MDNIVNFSDIITIGSSVIGNVAEYDYFISVDSNLDDTFNTDFLTLFSPLKAVAFIGLYTNSPRNYPIPCHNLLLSTLKSATTVNLDFYVNSFKNMFLKIKVNYNEYLWIKEISTTKLNTIKQLLIVMHESNYQTIVNKFNATHDLIYAQKTTNKNVELTFIRKDIISNLCDLHGDDNNYLINNIDIDGTGEESPISNEDRSIVEEQLIEDYIPIAEEQQLIVEEQSAEDEPESIVEEQSAVEEQSDEDEPEPIFEEQPFEDEPEPIVEEQPAEEWQQSVDEEI